MIVIVNLLFEIGQKAREIGQKAREIGQKALETGPKSFETIRRALYEEENAAQAAVKLVVLSL